MPHLYRRSTLVALAAVVGPGLLAGLSDDDPPGITTYSVLGADFGYRLLWVLLLSTATLIVFHLLAARIGCVTGIGFTALVRHRYGHRSAIGSAVPLVVANIGTTCAELAGVAAAAQIAGIPRIVAVPSVAVGVSAFVVSGTFRRVERVFLALSVALAAYIVAGVLAGPDWHAAAHGLFVPSLPAGRHALVLVSATVGTTLAPWGLASMQSYAVDKKLKIEDWRYERIDVIVGALMTGVVGLFIVIACAATLHARGLHINDASDAARALRPLAGSAASALFAAGLFGAALLAHSHPRRVLRLPRCDRCRFRRSARHHRWARDPGARRHCCAHSAARRAHPSGHRSGALRAPYMVEHRDPIACDPRDRDRLIRTASGEPFWPAL
jgi:Mn2+/Fe2+ NRAMP family transporter